MLHTLSVSLKSLNMNSKFFNVSRLYSRNITRRKPIKILNDTSEEGLITSIKDEVLSSHTKSQLTLDTSAKNALTLAEEKKSEILIPPYEKLQRNDARFAKTLTIIKNRKLRERKGKILIEGKRLINDAIKAGIELQGVYFSREKDLADVKFRDQKNVEICKVQYKTLKVWSDLTTCPGVMGIFKRPNTDHIHVLCEPVLPVTIICDNIREPGNLGSIIRNAAAAGCENILLTKGCTDPWGPKVLRAGSGGHFRIPIINNIEWTHLTNYLSKESQIYIADNSADIEGDSLSAEFISFDELEEGEDEPKKYFTKNENDEVVYIDETFKEPSELKKYEDINLPCYLYSTIKYPKQNIVVYVGGETHGVDPKVVKLACEYGGKKVKIPLENDMESLNSSFAVTIMLYEIKRQLSEIYVTK